MRISDWSSDVCSSDLPGFGRKALLYATCFANYNSPSIGIAARRVLARNGVETEVVYPACCGMPQFEHGDVARVAETAVRVAAELRSRVDAGWTMSGLVPSCVLLVKFEDGKRTRLNARQ